MTLRTRIGATLLAAATLLGACSSGDDDAATEPAESRPDADAGTAESAGGIRVVSPAEAAAIQADAPADLVVLDVRTPEEFDQAHLDGAVMIDFYRDDFAAQIAELDRDVPYVLYCRSGNRSGQTRALMSELGFTDVADVDGGIVAWNAAGLPLVGG